MKMYREIPLTVELFREETEEEPLLEEEGETPVPPA